MPSPLRGEIYFVDWEPHRGSEQAGHRPGLVISSDEFNRNWSVCTVLALTTAIKQSQLAVELPPDVTGERCQILPWQVMTVAQSRLEDFIATLDSTFMARVEDSLRVIWHLKEPT